MVKNIWTNDKKYFNKQNAIDLIEWWDIDFLVENLWKFSWLDNEVAEKLIEKWYKSYLAWNLKYFKDLNDDTASTLLKIWYWKYVKENKDSFSDFWEQSYYLFEKNEDFKFITSNFERFSYVDVKSLWNKYYPGFFLENLGNLKDNIIDKDTEYFLIKSLRNSGNTDYLLKNASKFKFYTPDEILKLLLDWGLDVIYWDIVWWIINNLDVFKNITEEIENKILSKLKSHRMDTLVQNIEKFRYIPQNILFDKILSVSTYTSCWWNYDGYLLWHFIDIIVKFDKLKKTNYEKIIVNKLLEENHIDKILYNFNHFTQNIDCNELLVKLLMEEKYDVIIEFIDKFSIDKKSLYEKALKQVETETYWWNTTLKILMKNLSKFEWITEEMFVDRMLKQFEKMDKNYKTEDLISCFLAWLTNFKQININKILEKLYELWFWESLLYIDSHLFLFDIPEGIVGNKNIIRRADFKQKLLDEYMDSFILNNKDIEPECFDKDIIPTLEYALDNGLNLDGNMNEYGLNLVASRLEEYVNKFDNSEPFDIFFEEMRFICSFFECRIFPEKKVNEIYKIYINKRTNYTMETWNIWYILWSPYRPYIIDTSYMYNILRSKNVWYSWLFLNYFNEYWVLPWLSDKSIDELLELLFKDWEYSIVRRIMNIKDYYIPKYIKYFVDSKDYESLSKLVYNSSFDKRRKIISIIEKYDKNLVDKNWEDLKEKYIEYENPPF